MADNRRSNPASVKTFHSVLVGLSLLFAAFMPTLHIAIGIAMLKGMFNGGPSHPPAFFGWLLIVLGVLSSLLLLGYAAAGFIAGSSLGLRRCWLRTSHHRNPVDRPAAEPHGRRIADTEIGVVKNEIGPS